jgi:two-component system chemotaxis response regulator CheY
MKLEDKKTAIILDDEPAILEYLELILETLGYEVKTYLSPVLCPLYNETIPCDVLITDNNMPGMNGIEFIKHLRQQERKVDRIAVMSGNWEDETFSEAEQLNCKIIKKPFEGDVIIDWVNG